MGTYEKYNLIRRPKSFNFLIGNPYLCLDNETFCISTRDLSKLLLKRLPA